MISIGILKIMNLCYTSVYNSKLIKTPDGYGCS